MNPRLAFIVGTLAATLAGVLVAASNTTSTASGDYPITGMTISELSRFVDAVKDQIPASERIISVSIKNSSKVTVTTGHLEGPLAGGGEKFTFEYKNDTNRWQITERYHWIS